MLITIGCRVGAAETADAESRRAVIFGGSCGEDVPTTSSSMCTWPDEEMVLHADDFELTPNTLSFAVVSAPITTNKVLESLIPESLPRDV